MCVFVVLVMMMIGFVMLVGSLFVVCGCVVLGWVVVGFLLLCMIKSVCLLWLSVLIDGLCGIDMLVGLCVVGWEVGLVLVRLIMWIGVCGVMLVGFLSVFVLGVLGVCVMVGLCVVCRLLLW